MPYAVLLRDAAAVEPYVGALGALGLEVVAMPVTRVEPPHDTRALARALERAPQLIVVASARAATALVEAGPSHEAEIWAVGPATARVLARAGLSARVPELANATALAQAIVDARDLRGVRVLVPRAEDGRQEGIEILRAAGALVDDVVAYRTVAVGRDDPAIGRGIALLGQADWCVAFAPSQVHALAALVPLDGLRFAAIGETTAATLRALGVEPVVAASPTPEGLASALGNSQRGGSGVSPLP